MNKNKPYRIIYNCDCTEAFGRFPPPVTAEQLCSVVDEVAGTQVDAFCWSPNAGDMIVFYASKVAEVYGAGLRPDTDLYTKTLAHLFRHGQDLLTIYLRRAKEQRMDFFASIRMNDLHHKSDQRGPFASRFWINHPEYRCWERNACGNYHNAALDFTYPEVRRRRLAVIEEIVRNYRVDGIELDFGRNPDLFNPAEAWGKRQILTAFVRQVRGLLQEVSRQKRRNLKLLIRTPFYPSGDRHVRHEPQAEGIDLETWMKESLADIFTLSPLEGNDYGLKLDYWKRLADSAGVWLYAGIEACTKHNAPAHNHVLGALPDETRGIAQNYHHQKPDGIYLFNYPCSLSPSAPARYRDYLKALSQIGRLATLRRVNKTYVFYGELPIELEVDRPARYYQTIAFTVFEPELAARRGRWEITFKVTGFPERKALQILLNGKRVRPGWIRWRKDCGGLKAGGITVRDGRGGYPLGTHYEVVTIEPPAAWINCGDNTLGFQLTDGPRWEHTGIEVHELEVRSRYPAARR